MRLPDFLVIGAAKSATTTLADMLRLHPEIHLPEEKELNHYSHDENFERGVVHYLSRLGDPGTATVVGEASPAYTMRHAYPRTAIRMSEEVGNARLIFIAREPFRRIESQWLYDVHVKRRPETPRCFDLAIRTDPSLIEATRYMWMLEPFLERFPRENILLLTFEELLDRPQVVLSRVTDFLGVSACEVPTLGVSNPTGRTPPWFETLSSTGLARRLGRFARPGLRRRIRYLFRRNVRRPTWSPDSEGLAHRRLRSEAAEYLRLAGEPLDRWNITRGASGDESGRCGGARAA